jgi:hypothetical protein
VTARLRGASALLAFGLLAGACTGSGPGTAPIRTEAPVPSSPESVSPAPTGPASAEAALKRLCRHPALQPPSRTAAEGRTPPAVAKVEAQVQQLRDLRFTHRVPVDATTHEQLVRGLAKSFKASYPRMLYARRSLAWQAIGVIPPGASLRVIIQRFASTQVIGYYDPLTGDLVFVGADNPTPVERVTLAHELTHALDDQHFDLSRLDGLDNRCQAEAYQAALGAVEGDATYFMSLYAQRFLSLAEQIQLGLGAAGSASVSGIPPFVLRYETWPYTAGLAFIGAMDRRGGTKAIDRAIQHLPVSTEQVIHPQRYPNDVPTPVDITELSSKLGIGWKDLDVMDVGEAFLSIMLGLRLSEGTAASAAAGWDGGLYRAWSNGSRVALELSTVWDTTRDASEFGSAMERWLGDRASATVLPVNGTRVMVLFASDARTFSELQRAAA